MFYLGGYGNPAAQGFSILKRDKQGRAPTHVMFIPLPLHCSSSTVNRKLHLSPL
jgi:hypothetical protein